MMILYVYSGFPHASDSPYMNYGDLTWSPLRHVRKNMDQYLVEEITFTYKLHFRCMKAHWKDLNEKKIVALVKEILWKYLSRIKLKKTIFRPQKCLGS